MRFTMIKNNASNSPKHASSVLSQGHLIPAASAPGGNAAPRAWLAQGTSPLWKSERLGCVQTHGRAPTRGRPRPHTGARSQEARQQHSRRAGVGCCGGNPGPPRAPQPRAPTLARWESRRPPRGPSSPCGRQQRAGGPVHRGAPCSLEKGLCLFLLLSFRGRERQAGVGFAVHVGSPQTSGGAVNRSASWWWLICFQ